MSDIMEQLILVRDSGLMQDLGQRFVEGLKEGYKTDNEELKNLRVRTANSEAAVSMFQELTRAMAQTILDLKERVSEHTTIEEILDSYNTEGEEDGK